MGRKPLLTVTGTFLTSLALAGCQSSTTHPVTPTYTPTTTTMTNQPKTTPGQTGTTPVAFNGQGTTPGQQMPPVPPGGQTNSQFGQSPTVNPGTQFNQTGAINPNSQFGSTGTVNPGTQFGSTGTVNSGQQFNSTATNSRTNTSVPALPPPPSPYQQPATNPFGSQQPLNTISNSAPVQGQQYNGAAPVTNSNVLQSSGQPKNLQPAPSSMSGAYNGATPAASLPSAGASTPSFNSTLPMPPLPPQGPTGPVSSFASPNPGLPAPPNPNTMFLPSNSNVQLITN